jgi:hypothetical protein
MSLNKTIRTSAVSREPLLRAVRSRRGCWATSLALAAIIASSAGACLAAETPAKALLQGLTPEHRQLIDAAWKAQSANEGQLVRYWRQIEEKRAERRRKRAAGGQITAADYVAEHPPANTAPKLPPELVKKLAQLAPRSTTLPLPTVEDYLKDAREQFGFVPETTTEIEFKRRYAREALSVGLTKGQVVNIYAFETGGEGTYDMQSGINPVTKKGHAISSALGYAQLLHANSVDELVQHGEGFVRRLEAGAKAAAGDPARAAALQAKAGILRDMLDIARIVPDQWDEQTKFARSGFGGGIHMINLDGDIGPWLQVIKLKGLLEYARKGGLAAPTAAQLELMNLAGPGTGLEMMTPIGLPMPTANFFDRNGYERNSIVREKISSALLAKIEEWMANNVKKQGAVDFAVAFDEVSQGR